MTIRRACAALHFDRSTYHYQSRRTDPAFLKKRIKEICETHVRYGYRRVHYILRRDGWHVNLKKVYRLYRETAPSAQEQDTQAAGQGEAARGSCAGGSAERCVRNGVGRKRPSSLRFESVHD